MAQEIMAFQMDPFSRLAVQGDSTLALAQEASSRGYRLFAFQPEGLSLGENSQPVAQGRFFSVEDGKQGNGDLGPDSVNVSLDERLPLGNVEVVWVRQDPPYDMRYLTATWLLDHFDGLVVNDPRALRDFPEKLSIFRFSDLIPPSIISQSYEELRAFHEKHKEIVLKPLFGSGGFGVVRLGHRNQNLPSLLELFAKLEGLPIFAQAFLPSVVEGDRRVIIVEGKAIGVINRRPEEGSFRANMHVGGKAEAAELTTTDLKIVDRLSTFLFEAGVVFAGIDIIGGYLTEINITSPTGLVELKRFQGSRPAEIILDAVERRLRTKTARLSLVSVGTRPHAG